MEILNLRAKRARGTEQSEVALRCQPSKELIQWGHSAWKF